jgi:DNA-3-methyladenine glycosylase I
MTAAVAGPDGKLRCPWSLSPPEYLDYHDREWGQPVTTVSGLYERMTLEAFQSGLSWITILRKRENFRAAFDQFVPERVASYDETEVERLTLAEVPARSAASVALSQQLRKRGIRFLGPTTTYATMQAVGLVNDHLLNCWVLVPRLT